MDITTVFGTVIAGSNPAESNNFAELLISAILFPIELAIICCQLAKRVWFSGKRDLAKIQSPVRFSTRTKQF